MLGDGAALDQVQVGRLLHGSHQRLCRHPAALPLPPAALWAEEVSDVATRCASSSDELCHGKREADGIPGVMWYRGE